MPATNSTSSTKNAPSRAGRRFGIGVFALIVGGITLTLSIEIIVEAFDPAVTPLGAQSANAGPRRCASALAPLWDALGRARRSAAEADSEQAAVNAFRQQLDPEWTRLPEARGACEADAESGRALAELVSLRFEEEHAVRFEARGLAAARQRVQRWIASASAAAK